MSESVSIRSRKVLVITGDPLGHKLAGPAIRAWNMALELSKNHEVKLLSFTGADISSPHFEVVFVAAGDSKRFDPIERWADVIIFQGHAMLVFEALQDTKKIVVVDIYDPMHLEQLEQARELPREMWISQVQDATDVLNDQLARGDFFLCASERQRLFWLGQLAALGRINPLTYEHDPDLTGLISVAPFGLSRIDPQHQRTVLKGIIPGIGTEDKVLLWSGGLYNWFDPETLIRAVGILAKKQLPVRLFFLGTKHPHPGVPEMEIVSKSKKLATELNIINTHVFFNDSWVDFDDRQNYLLEADLGVSTHHDHIETTFSFRTRILDYLWAGLPMVVTKGDHFADLVETEQLGFAVPAGNPFLLAEAIETAVFDSNFRAKAIGNISRVRKEYFWDVVLKPLSRFVDNAHHAADKIFLSKRGKSSYFKPRKKKPTSGFGHDIKLTLSTLKTDGIKTVLSKIGKRLMGQFPR